MKVACSCNACQSCWTLGKFYTLCSELGITHYWTLARQVLVSPKCHTLCDELALFHDFRECA